MESRTTHSNIQTSIWDGLNTGNTQSLWLTTEQCRLIDLKHLKPLITTTDGSFFDDKMKKIAIDLYEQYLVLRDHGSSEVTSIMDLSLVKCRWINEQGYLGFHFTKDQHAFSILTKHPKLFRNWKAAVRRLVVVTDFHEEFEVSHQIGEGTFARVRHLLIIS